MTVTNEVEKTYKIFDIRMVLDSMKDSGYKDAAHALAELIDNSIQAGEETDRKTEVEVICLEKSNQIKDGQRSRIEKIAVYDNASGMDANTLAMALAFGQGTRKGATNGLGKFGMGLPNASISQCDRVDVWSWQNNRIFHTFLDLDEIAEKGYEEVPFPSAVDEIPELWRCKIKSEIQDSGTLVVWSKLERLKWKRHKAFFDNSAFIVGRMYRYFINDEKCSIRMAAYLQDSITSLMPHFEQYVKPNDPLYLMANTQCPSVSYADYSKEPAFELFIDRDLKVNINGKESCIKIKASMVKSREQDNGNLGSTEFGRHCAKNQGISLVRSGRELEMNRSFEISYDTLERWWGIEVSFSPELDSVFGVTNNKQSATSFKKITMVQLAEEEGRSKAEIEDILKAENDYRYIISQVADEINSILKNIRDRVKTMESRSQAKSNAEKDDLVVNIASKFSKQDGVKGKSDLEYETLSYDEKKAIFEKDIVESFGEDIDKQSKEVILKSWLNDDTKFIFTSEEIRSSYVMFDVAPKGGKIKVAVNKRHPVYKHFIQKLEEEDGDAYAILKLLFLAWARIEDTCDEKDEDKLEKLRMDWGQKVKEMLNHLIPD